MATFFATNAWRLHYALLEMPSLWFVQHAEQSLPRPKFTTFFYRQINFMLFSCIVLSTSRLLSTNKKRKERNEPKFKNRTDHVQINSKLDIYFENISHVSNSKTPLVFSESCKYFDIFFSYLYISQAFVFCLFLICMYLLNESSILNDQCP